MVEIRDSCLILNTLKAYCYHQNKSIFKVDKTILKPMNFCLPFYMNLTIDFYLSDLKLTFKENLILKAENFYIKINFIFIITFTV